MSSPSMTVASNTSLSNCNDDEDHPNNFDALPPIVQTAALLKQGGIEILPMKHESASPELPLTSSPQSTVSNVMSVADMTAFSLSVKPDITLISRPPVSEKSESNSANLDFSSLYGGVHDLSNLQEKLCQNVAENMSHNEDWTNYLDLLDIHRKRLVKAKRHRSENVSERDKLLFLNLLAPKVDYIENRRIGGTSKMQMWREIEAQFNASAEVERTYDQLRELWKRLKIAMKKEIEAGRQKGFSSLSPSITRTFSLLKDSEFVDDLSNNNNNISGIISGRPPPVQNEEEFQANNIEQNTSELMHQQSDIPDFNLLNAIQLTKLLRKRDDNNKSFAERLSQSELSVTPGTIKTDSSTTSEISSCEDGKTIAERLAQSDLGLDLTITQVNMSNGTDGNSSLNKPYLCDENSESKNIRASNDSELQQSEPPIDSKLCAEIQTPSSDNHQSSNILNGAISQAFRSESPVPDLVKLQKNLTTAALGHSMSVSCVTSGSKQWDGGDMSTQLTTNRHNKKRRVEANSMQSSAALLSTLGHHQFAIPESEAGSGGTEAELVVQKLKNEQDKGRLLKSQLENEQLRKELLTLLLSKVKEGDSNVTGEAFKTLLT